MYDEKSNLALITCATLTRNTIL